MEALSKQKKFALLKVDIASWDSPVARQFNLHSIPHLLVYDRSGAKVADGLQAGINYINRL